MREAPLFSALSESFAGFLAGFAGVARAELNLAARLLCEAVSRGHVCLDLRRAAGGDLEEAFGAEPPPLETPAFDQWTAALRASPAVGAPGDFRPLVLDEGGRLYLFRYWQYQQTLIDFVRERAGEYLEPAAPAALEEALERYFPAGGGVDWQRTAALLALTRPFLVISGGPGTGKTSTVVRLLALLLEQQGRGNLEIALAAPTGKAAARLWETVERSRGELPCSERVREGLPREVQTLHRLLGPLRNSPRFRHNRDNPLRVDLLVVDEASMIDLPLLARTVEALPPGGRLLLLGDHHQLASVEAGAVLGDLCGTGEGHPFSPNLRRRFGRLLALPETCYGPEGTAGLADSLVVLGKNYRFGEASVIGRLGEAVKAGEAETALALLGGGAKDARRLDLPPPQGLKSLLEETVVAEFGACLARKSVEEALEQWGRFMLLCALRRGPYGVENLNALCREILAGQGLIRPRGPWYRGRPVMISGNDYRLNLFNGDVGMAWPEPRTGELRVYFPAPGGGLRSLAPGRLPAHRTVFATTVHKSQGSEFDRVMLMLPPGRSPVLTRELVYTGLTRARSRVEVVASPELLRWAVERRIERTSGLREALWGPGRQS